MLRVVNGTFPMDKKFYKAGIVLPYQEPGISSLMSRGVWNTEYRPHHKTVRPDGTPMFVFTNERDAVHLLEGLSWWHQYEIWEGYTTQPLMDVPPGILNEHTRYGLLFWQCVREGINIPTVLDRSFQRDVYWDMHEPLEGTALVMDFTITRMVHVQREHRPN
jgi:hypothetical protein